MPKVAQQSKEKKTKNPIPTTSNTYVHFTNLISIVDVKQMHPRYTRVIKVLGRTGSRGGVQQVRVELMEDPERTLVRNVIVITIWLMWANNRDR